MLVRLVWLAFEGWLALLVRLAVLSFGAGLVHGAQGVASADRCKPAARSCCKPLRLPPPLPSCRFRQVALKALMQSIAEEDGESSQQFRDMRRVFEQMDRDLDGRVTYSEVGCWDALC